MSSYYLGDYTDEQAREVYDAYPEIEEQIREWLRYSDGEFARRQIQEMHETMTFEVDAWDNVYAWPRYSAACCGALAAAVRASKFGYPSTIEDALAKLERYAEGVDRLGGSIWSIPDHFERAIEEVEREVCDEYARCIKADFQWWMDATSDELFDYFRDDVDEWIKRCPDAEYELEERLDEERRKLRKQQARKMIRKQRRRKRRLVLSIRKAVAA